jgi:hypothetical protein
MSTPITRIPSSRKRSAVARPIPPDAPVTTAIFPLTDIFPPKKLCSFYYRLEFTKELDYFAANF